MSRLRIQTNAKKLSDDLAAFVHAAWPILEPITELSWNWHLDLICEYLTLIKQNRFKEVCGAGMEGIIFNVPPRTMKSLLITVFFPVWVWTTDPARRWMFASYAEKLSTQHSLYRRNVIESPWYQQRWGHRFSLAKDLNLKTHYDNSARGSMFSTAMQAAATGMGGDVLVFDDPMNPDQALSATERQSINDRFDQTFRSRLNDPATGVKVIVMQRLHEEDLTGHVLNKEGDRWVHVKLPAIAEVPESIKFPGSGRTVKRLAKQLLWPARLPEPQLAGLKIGLGSWAFAGQYQQNPAPLEGGIVKRNWIRFYRELPERFDLLVQSWDCTFKGESTARGADTDFVAGQVWGKSGGKYYMLPYRLHERLDFGPTKAAIQACHAAFPRAHAILIEDKANGPAIISELQQVIPGIIAIDPEGGKLARAHSISPLWEAGSIVLPDPQVFNGQDAAHPQANWLEEYIHNICTFPQAAHDDDMDATSQALIYMRHKMGGGILDFYRDQAERQLASDNTARGLPPSKGARVPETRLTQTIKDAIGKMGRTILCSKNQYPEVRQALLDLGNEVALAEVERIDEELGWKIT